MPIACKLFFESAQGALIWPFLRMRKVHWFSLCFNRLFTDTYEGFFALIKLRWKAQAIACLVAFTLLYFNIFKLNASGSWATIESVPLPNPWGGLENLQSFSISPMQNLEQILALLSAECHWFEAHWISGKSRKEKEAFAWSLWQIPRSLWVIFPQPTTLWTRSSSADVSA